MRNDKDAEIKTKYDDFSVEELKAALKNIFLYSGEFSDADMEEMDQIMAALDRKEPITPKYTAEESLKRFQETYADELSSLGVHSTEEVIQKDLPADADEVHSTAEVKPTVEVKPARPVRRRTLLRVAAVAAAIVVIFVAAAATAYALGYDIFGWVPKWNNDVLSFGEDESPATNELHDSSHIVAALKDLGVDEPLYPTWLPEGFEIEFWVIEKDPSFLPEGYTNGDRYLSITIEPSESAQTYVYQKEESDPLEYATDRNAYYIVFDNEQYTAVWKTDNFSAYIAGNISIEEMKLIIDSIREVK